MKSIMVKILVNIMAFLIILQVEKIRPQSDLVFEYSCTEAQTQCSGSKGKAGIALSHCCLRELSTFVKLVMRKCKVSCVPLIKLSISWKLVLST